jgi:hypothetical protein
MASTFTLNINLSTETDAEYIEGIEHVGAYLVIVKCEDPKGTHAIFHLAASQGGQSRVKAAISVPGSNGEELVILWPSESQPILTFDSKLSIPTEPQSYNLKVI